MQQPVMQQMVPTQMAMVSSQQMTNFTTKQNHSPQAMTVGSTSDPSNIWYPNLGAFHHVTANVENVQQCSSLEGPDQVIVGNGQGLPIKSIGSSSL